MVAKYDEWGVGEAGKVGEWTRGVRRGASMRTADLQTFHPTLQKNYHPTPLSPPVPYFGHVVYPVSFEISVKELSISATRLLAIVETYHTLLGVR